MRLRGCSLCRTGCGRCSARCSRKTEAEGSRGEGVSVQPSSGALLTCFTLSLRLLSPLVLTLHAGFRAARNALTSRRFDLRSSTTHTGAGQEDIRINRTGTPKRTHVQYSNNTKHHAVLLRGRERANHSSSAVQAPITTWQRAALLSLLPPHVAPAPPPRWTPTRSTGDSVSSLLLCCDRNTYLGHCGHRGHTRDTLATAGGRRGLRTRGTASGKCYDAQRLSQLPGTRSWAGSWGRRRDREQCPGGGLRGHISCLGTQADGSLVRPGDCYAGETTYLTRLCAGSLLTGAYRRSASRQLVKRSARRHASSGR